MEALLRDIGHSVALAVEAIAILIIAVGSIEALVNIARAMFAHGATSASTRKLQHVGTCAEASRPA